MAEPLGDLCFLVPDFPAQTAAESPLPVVVYYHRLASELQARGWRVHVLTDLAAAGRSDADEPVRTTEGVEVWNASALARGVCAEVHELSRDCHPLHGRSALFHHALLALLARGEQLKLVEYPEQGALGFIPALQHRSRRGYGDARLICTLHGPLLQLRDAGELDRVDLETLKVGWLERSSYQNADVRQATCPEIARWASTSWSNEPETPVHASHPWRDADEYAPPTVPATDFAFTDLAFLGLPELDEKASLPHFLGALPESSPKVRFIGRPTRLRFTFSSQTTAGIISQRLQRPGRRWQLIEAEDEAEMIRRLRDQPPKDRQTLAIYLPRSCPAPTAILLDLLRRRLPFITARTGCIPELLGPRLAKQLTAPPEDRVAIRRRLRDLLAADAAALADLALEIDQRWRQIQSVEERVAKLERLASVPATPARAPNLQTRAPEVTVVIPFYNAAPWVSACLASLERQTASDFQIVLVDDGSDDPRALDKLEDIRRNAPWVRTLRQTNGGVGSAMNLALDEIDSEHLIEFDADNIARPELIATLAQGMHNRPEIAGLSCYNGAFYDADEHHMTEDSAAVWRHVRWYWRMIGPALPVLFFENVQGDACAMLRTAALRRIGGFPDDRRGFHDWGLWLKLIAHGHLFDVLPEVLYYHRQHGGSDGNLKQWFNIDRQNQRLIGEISSRQPELFAREVYPHLHRLCRQAVTLEARQQSLVEKGLRSFREVGPRVTARRVVSWWRGRHARHSDD